MNAMIPNLGLVCRLWLFALLFAPIVPRASAQVISSISQLYRLADMSQRYHCQTRLEATVLASNPKASSLVLHDSSGDAIFQINLQGQQYEPGTRVLIEGMCTIDGARFSFVPDVLIDNDGFHPAVEKSQRIFLGAGRHSFRTVAFNGSGDFVLELGMQSPETPRQQVPDSAFFRSISGQTGADAWTNGLEYRCFEGQFERVPNFAGMAPTKTGTVANLDVSVASRKEHVALEFCGYIEVPKSGLYTFFLKSDDGSMLQIGTDTARVTVIGTNSVPVPRRILPGEPLAVPEDPQWAEVEGMVKFVAQNAGGLILEVVTGTGRMRVEVEDAGSFSPTILSKSRIRAKGLFQSTFTPDGHWIAGALLVQNLRHTSILSISENLWEAHPAVPITQALNLSPEDLIENPEAIVHLKGRFVQRNKTLLLCDPSGEVEVQLFQELPKNLDSAIEAVGCLLQDGTNSQFQCAFWRQPNNTNTESANTSSAFTMVEQVKGLKREEALRELPVLVRGVLTMVNGEGGSGVIQDATGGIYYNLQSSPTFHAKVGDYCELYGVTGPGDFAPVVNATNLVRLGVGIMPEPVRPTWDQLMNGSLDTQYIEVQGIVTEVREGGIRLLTRMGPVNMGINGASLSLLKSYENAVVRLRGVLIPAWDKETHRVKYGEMAVSSYSFGVDQPALADPFALPARHVPELQLFDINASRLQLVKIVGTVVYEKAGEYFIMDGTNGLRVIPKKNQGLRVGDLVEAVGYPQLNTPSPVLHEALMRKTGHVKLPSPTVLTETNLLSGEHDAEIVQVDARLVNLSSTRDEQILELQAGSRTFSARLRNRFGVVEAAPRTELRLVGVYDGRGGDRNQGIGIESFELLLGSARDVTVLSKPTWWTLKHTLATLAILLAVLLLAGQWITQLQHRVEERTRQLREEIENHKRTEAQLHEKTAALEEEIVERTEIQNQLTEQKNLLENEIEERKKLETEKEQIHKELLVASRQAGMAEVATGVLHNVGNVLNSINVSASFLSEKTHTSKSANVAKIAALLEENAADLPRFLTQDERGRKLPAYMKLLSENLASEQRDVQKELQSLQDNINHIKDIVSMQQSYGRMTALIETVAIKDLIETAFKMHTGGYLRHQVQLKREFDEVPPVTTDRHKVLQILVNLLQNAKYACGEGGREDKQVLVRVRKGSESTVRIEVIDNGIGIPAENLTKIFRHGFTTRKNGHGFGLHSGALAAKELGGALTVSSEGTGKGATFILELPVSLSK